MLFEKPRQSDEYDLSTPPLCLGRSWGRSSWEAMLKHVEKRGVIQDLHGFTKSKFCLTNLVVFFDGVTTLMDETKAMDVIKAFFYF